MPFTLRSKSCFRRPAIEPGPGLPFGYDVSSLMHKHVSVSLFCGPDLIFCKLKLTPIPNSWLRSILQVKMVSLESVILASEVSLESVILASEVSSETFLDSWLGRVHGHPEMMVMGKYIL